MCRAGGAEARVQRAPLSTGDAHVSERTPEIVTASSPLVVCALILATAMLALLLWPTGTQRVNPQPPPATLYGRFADDWGVTEAEITIAETRVRRAFGSSALGDSLATFLLVKGVTDEDARRGLGRAVEKEQAAAQAGVVIPMPHVSVYSDMPYLYWFLTSTHPLAKSMRERSGRLLAGGDTPLQADYGFKASAALDAFIDGHPLWTEDGAFVSLRRPRLNSSIISRVQLSGVCFLHSAIVGLHYLRNFFRPAGSSAQSNVVDITSCMLRTLTDGSLSRYVFCDDGGYTEEVIRQLYLPADGQAVVDLLESGNHETDFAVMRQRLEDHVVGFVYSFDVEPAFSQMGVTSYFMRQSPQPPPALAPPTQLHSMLLIGIRFDTCRNEYVMLLQNWWEAKEFVEVGQAYWKASSAKLLFVLTPQTSLRTGVRTVPHVRAAAGVIGAGVMRSQPTRASGAV